jgi:hypothetical protein
VPHYGAAISGLTQSELQLLLDESMPPHPDLALIVDGVNPRRNYLFPLAAQRLTSRDSLYFVIDAAIWPELQKKHLIDASANGEIERVLSSLEAWRSRAQTMGHAREFDHSFLSCVQHARVGRAIYSLYNIEGDDVFYGFAKEAAVLTRSAKTSAFGPFLPVADESGLPLSLIPNDFIPPVGYTS